MEGAVHRQLVVDGWIPTFEPVEALAAAFKGDLERRSQDARVVFATTATELFPMMVLAA